MKREKAQMYFEAGGLTICRIVPAPMAGAGYLMELEDRSGVARSLETTRKGQTRVFRTLDAAANEARTIGFRTVQVYL